MYGGKGHIIFPWINEQVVYYTEVFQNEYKIRLILTDWTSGLYKSVQSLLRSIGSLEDSRKNLRHVHSNYITRKKLKAITNHTTERVSMMFDRMNDVIINAPRTSDFFIYRGFKSKDRILKMKVGDTLTDHGFMATSLLLNSATDFADEDGVVINIEVTENTPLLYINYISRHYGEEECLLPSGALIQKKSDDNIFTFLGIDATHDVYDILNPLIEEYYYSDEDDVEASFGNHSMFDDSVVFNETIPPYFEVGPPHPYKAKKRRRHKTF